ncbi:MAG: DoxX family membrane protein [Planctomycetes bacterium]|nr:DoxX family membrane protein [Planctomycetota bacterium]MBL7106451.1 DoxX family membrane protein [Phycisphaerae bacterium]
MKFNRKKTKQIISVLLFFTRIVIGCVFLWASLPKIRQPYDFLSSVYDYELVGAKLGMFIAMTLPWLEILVGICLIAGVFVSGAFLVSAGMTLMFTFVIGSALYHGLEISCGCFGMASNGIINYSTLIRDCALLLFTVLGYIGAVTLQSHPVEVMDKK